MNKSPQTDRKSIKKNILLVDANYYEVVSKNLLTGIKEDSNMVNSKFDYVKVSGALEIPIAINLIFQKNYYDGVIGVGCVIKGETEHYDIVANLSAKGLMDISIKYNVPISNAILTVNNYQQALERSDPNLKNRGGHAAKALYSLMNISHDSLI